MWSSQQRNINEGQYTHSGSLVGEICEHEFGKKNKNAVLPHVVLCEYSKFRIESNRIVSYIPTFENGKNYSI